MVGLFVENNFIVLSSIYRLKYISSLINPSEGRQSNVIKHNNIYNYKKIRIPSLTNDSHCKKASGNKYSITVMTSYTQATTLDIGARCSLCGQQSPVSINFANGKLSCKICFGNYFENHYSDTIMWRLKSPASPFFTQPFIQAQIKDNIKAPRHWSLCGEVTGHRWLPLTNGQ